MTRFAWEIGAFLLSLAQPPSSGIALSSLKWGEILSTCTWRKCLTSTQSRTTTRKRPSCYERKRVRQASDQQPGFESGLTLRLHWEMSTIFAGIFDLSKGCLGEGCWNLFLHYTFERLYNTAITIMNSILLFMLYMRLTSKLWVP